MGKILSRYLGCKFYKYTDIWLVQADIIGSRLSDIHKKESKNIKFDTKFLRCNLPPVFSCHSLSQNLKLKT